jgi:2'-5' RNA ligase
MTQASERLRLFVAIQVPEPVKEALRQMQQELESASSGNVRWSSSAQMHLTLLFLGYVGSSELPGVQTAFQAVCRKGEPMQFTAKGLGAFPSERRPRVIWAGVEGDVAKLNIFQAQLQEALLEWCEKAETLEYRPHLTMGRVREGGDVRRLGEVIHPKAAATFGHFTADACSLMRSQLSPQGAVYSEVAVARFSR